MYGGTNCNWMMKLNQFGGFCINRHKKSGDLQWRILKGAFAVNSVVSIMNPNIRDSCDFCVLRETIFYCFLDCNRLEV